MATLKELREKMARLATEARAKLNEITADTSEARAAETEAEFDAMMAEHDRIGQTAERLQKLADVEARGAAVDERRRPGQPPVEVPGAADAEAIGYREAFYRMIANGGTGDLDPEVRRVLQQGEIRAQTVGTAAAGGYTAPVELASFIEQSMLFNGPMYSADWFTNINSSNGNTFNIPTMDDAAGTFEAHTEATAPTDDGGKDVVFGQKVLSAYAFNSEWIRWSIELAQDSIFNLESLLGDAIGTRLGRTANTKLTTGTGTSDVEGIVTNSALGKTAAAVAAITSDEIIDLVHSVDPAYREAPKTAFMMNDSTLSAVRKLKDGNGNYLWQMGNIQAGIPSNILGYPVLVNQAMASLAASQKVMLFGDMKKFYVRKVGAPSVFVARERFAPDLGILGYARFDGVLVNTAAIKHLINAAV